MDQRPYYDYRAAQQQQQLGMEGMATSGDGGMTPALAQPQQHLQSYAAVTHACYPWPTFDVGQPQPQPNAYQWTEAQIKDHNERNARLKLAELRALDLLQKHIGAPAVAAIQAGGGYPVKSKLWPGVVYLVPLGTHTRIKVMDNGVVVAESCLISDDSLLPWPDLMLQRIRAIELDETIVHTTGVVHTPKRRRIPRWANTLMGREE